MRHWKSIFNAILFSLVFTYKILLKCDLVLFLWVMLAVGAQFLCECIIQKWLDTTVSLSQALRSLAGSEGRDVGWLCECTEPFATCFCSSWMFDSLVLKIKHQRTGKVPVKVKDCNARLKMPLRIDHKYLHPLARGFKKEMGRKQGW